MRTIEIVIVTGASRGIGYELFQQLQAKKKRVIGLARTVPADVDTFESVDFANSKKLEEVFSKVIQRYIDEATSFTLINNAGTVEPIGKIGTVNTDEIENALAVNLTAPMILCNIFIRKLEQFTGEKKIMNISSGAGRNPYEGWGTYCTTKAGLDHFSRVVALEQAIADYPVEIVSIAPGIIDTSMQETIRGSSEGAFPLLNQFIDYKEQGMLSSPEETAEKLIQFIEEADFNKIGPIADIRNY